MELIKKTSLESSEDVGDTLKWKVAALTDGGLSVENGLADYVALAVGNLESRLDYIKSSQKIIADEKKAIEKQIKIIKNDGATYFAGLGMDKAEGVFCSSVSVTPEKPASTITTTEKIFTPLITQSEIEELLIGLGKAEIKKVTTTKTSNYIAPALRINKRKAQAVEIVE